MLVDVPLLGALKQKWVKGPTMILLKMKSVLGEDRAVWNVVPVTFLWSGLLVVLQKLGKLFLNAWSNT